MSTSSSKSHWFSLSSSVLLMQLIFAVSSQAATFTVTTTADSGPGSLRQAIIDANANAGADTIAFGIPGAGPHTIQPLTALPTITDPVIIDGYSQPGSSPNTLAEGDNAVLKIVLDGNLAGDELDGAPPILGVGLMITGGNTTVRGLVIANFSQAAIVLYLGGGNVIEGNFIGTDSTGCIAQGNALRVPWEEGAVRLAFSSDNVIGGTMPAARNLISGNQLGINISPGERNRIQGNFIGTDVTGTQAMPNIGRAGVFMCGACYGGSEDRDNVIGGSVPGAGNLISGNHHIPAGNPAHWSGGGYGIMVNNGGVTVIQGNRIGTDVTGQAKLGNQNGVAVTGWTAGNKVGGVGLGEGNLISGNDHVGLSIGGNGTIVQGNRIGTDITGTTVLGNDSGVSVQGENHLIGGADQFARNLISGNTNYGLTIQGAQNRVEGNFIGTDVTGTMALPNWRGIAIYGYNDNAVGGTAPGAGNLISGNVNVGVDLRSSRTRLQGNFIGTDVSGTVALGNSDGVYLGDLASNNLIGGVDPGAGNLISGNPGYAINLNGQGVSGTRVQGNHIGTDVLGALPLGNGVGVGINVANDNVIGGGEPGAANIIANSASSGIVVLLTGDGAGVRNAIRGNSIFNNGLLDPLILQGIDFIGFDGVTPNDPLDADSGPNNLQNYPVLGSASSGAGSITIAGTLNSTPNTIFVLDFYANQAAHASGYGEGEVYLGAASVTTDASGDVSFNISLPVTVAVDRVITATATDPDGNTSEFSGQSPPVTAACSITCPAAITVNTAPDATQCGAVVNFPAPTLNGPCGEVTCVPSSGSFFPVGTTTVRCTTAAGASCEFTVTVVDKTSPQITTPANVAAPCSADLLFPVTFSVSASDNCDPAPVLTCSPASGSGFPAGTTTVICTATDANGNSSTSAFTVTRAALDFTGFLPPIGGADATGGSFASPMRTFKYGSTIPVKFTASCGGTPVLTGAHRLQAIKYADATTAGDPIDATPQDAATTGNQFRLTDGQWHFNLDTKATGLTVGIWQLRTVLSDGSQHTVWIQLK